MSRLTVCFLAAFAALTLLLTANDAAARKKIVRPYGCSMAQLQANDPDVQKCLDMAEDDVRNNRRTIHVLKCNASGYLCCALRPDGTNKECFWPPQLSRPATDDRAPTDLPNEQGPTTGNPSARPPVVKPGGRGTN
jgi:hypothetical protein